MFVAYGRPLPRGLPLGATLNGLVASSFFAFFNVFFAMIFFPPGLVFPNEEPRPFPFH
jgi:hypothetical protein